MVRTSVFLVGSIRRFCCFSFIGMLLLFPMPAYPFHGDDVESGAMFLPPADLYPPYLADPQRAGFGIQMLRYTDTGIPDSGSNRVDIRAGGQFGIVRAGLSNAGDGVWQVDFLGGFNALIDADHSLDNMGWDGRLGLFVTTGKPRGTAFKFGALHHSSHVGDEFIARTGRARIEYTRHEISAGVSFPFDEHGEHWRNYIEGGWGFRLRNTELMKPGRGQMGMEYESCRDPHEHCTGWYSAVDLSATEERNWRLDTAAQMGVVAHADGRTWRIGVEWYQGRPPIGEFFLYTERYIGLGLWLDV
jgi:uncharacterized protein DUF1207